MSANVIIDAAKCDGCGICVDSCPTDVLRVDAASQRAVAAWPRDCQACFLCFNDCPRGAIRVEHTTTNTRRRSIYNTLGFTDEDLVYRGA